MMNTEKYYKFDEMNGYAFTKLQKIDDHFSITELEPINQKSFYGKAVIIITPFSSALFSYETPIIVRHYDERFDAFYYHRLYDGGYDTGRTWTDTVSPTTLRHIYAFCRMNKKEFMELPLYPNESRGWSETFSRLMMKRG